LGVCEKLYCFIEKYFFELKIGDVTGILPGWGGVQQTQGETKCVTSRFANCLVVKKYTNNGFNFLFCCFLQTNKNNPKINKGFLSLFENIAKNQLLAAAGVISCLKQLTTQNRANN
jgi:hypothetical protein